MADLATMDEWHYVGEAGEPAFGTDWDNVGAGGHLAFRLRESGIVDIQGSVENTSSPSAPTSILFTLPTGYRPSSDTTQGPIGVRVDSDPNAYVVGIIIISTDGSVFIENATVDPFPGSSGVVHTATLQGQFFLNPADAP